MARMSNDNDVCLLDSVCECGWMGVCVCELHENIFHEFFHHFHLTSTRWPVKISSVFELNDKFAWLMVPYFPWKIHFQVFPLELFGKKDFHLDFIAIRKMFFSSRTRSKKLWQRWRSHFESFGNSSSISINGKYCIWLFSYFPEFEQKARCSISI